MRALRENVARGAYDGYLGGWVFYGKVDLASLFGSTATPPEGANMVFYRSPEVDRLLAALDAAETADAGARAARTRCRSRSTRTSPTRSCSSSSAWPGTAGGCTAWGWTAADALASLESWWVDPR